MINFANDGFPNLSLATHVDERLRDHRICRITFLNLHILLSYDDHDHGGEDRDGEDGDDRELKDNGEGAKAKETEHGEAEQDCPVDVLNQDSWCCCMIVNVNVDYDFPILGTFGQFSVLISI